MKIKILNTFLNGRDRFEAGDVRTVVDDDGARFCAAGWAEDISGAVATGDSAAASTDLDIHPVTTGHTSTVGE